jgi:mono/diheme cytochrome c family protein
MPGFSSILTSNEIDSIIRHVASLGGPGTSTTTTVPPDAESGASIYGRLCTACHGANGSGGSGGPIVDTAFNGSSLAGVINNGLGTMPGFGSQLNAGQVSRLVAYVEGFAGGPDGNGPTAGVIGEDGQIDPAAGFTGHESETGGSSGEESAAALAANPNSNSPLPVGNPVGWTLAFAIAAFLVALGSALTGAMPKEADEGVVG